MTIQFLKYEPTPNEKHLGIATVKLYGKIILRYKIVPTKDGAGYFPAPASYKMPSDDGTDKYIGAFMLDSVSENEELINLIREHVKASIKSKSAIASNGMQSVGHQEGLPF